MKKTWKHINLEQRKLISSGIAHNDKLIEIAERLDLDPRSISKEVRRNRVPVDYTTKCVVKCPNLNRWPLVCTKGKLRYSRDCCYTKFKYDAKKAQGKADANLINSRKGIDLDSDEFKKLDSIIKNGIEAIETCGKIEILAEIKNDYAILKISNNGKPIPKDKQKNIFNQGYTTKKTGCGLGLSICKKNLAEQNATLELTKSLKNCTQFEIKVPVFS